MYFQAIRPKQSPEIMFAKLINTPITMVYWLGKQATVPDAISCSPILYNSTYDGADYQPSVLEAFLSPLWQIAY